MGISLTILCIGTLILGSWPTNVVSGTNSCCPAGNGDDCHPGAGANLYNCLANGCIWCPLPPGVSGPWCTRASNKAAAVRVDCHPDADASISSCQNRGCLWCSSADSTLKEPYCFFDSSNPSTMAGYDVQTISQYDNGVQGHMTRRNFQSITGSPWSGGVDFNVKFESASIIHVTLKKSSSRDPADRIQPNDEQVNYLFTVDVQNSPFGIVVTRKSTNTVVFDTRNIPGPILEDQYITISTLTPTANIYGFGEQTKPNLKQDIAYNKLPMFSRDQPVGAYNFNLYGTHPFYLVVENDGSTHGVQFINTYAQRGILKPTPSIQYESIGGNLEFRIFLGPTPAQVIQQYHSTIGMPILPPYWSLGFHLCRYGYTGLDNVKQVHDRMVASGIPYDTQWVDIDYMDGFRVFTYDHNLWAGLPQFSQQLHSEHRQFVTIIDPCIKSRDPFYGPLTDGQAKNVFLKLTNGNPYEGSVWPGCCYFPDFSCSQTQGWWNEWVKNWHDTANVDGLWIDMNEPSNAFCPNHPNNLGEPHCQYCQACSQNQWNNPPVNVLPTPITTKTVCMETRTCVGTQYSEHTKYGYYEALMTNKALQYSSPGKRPFILTRSSSPGSGSYTFHWTGDNYAAWEHLQYSIITIIEFGWFGIPMVGADICGFGGNPSQELCLRWMQLGAFYPFMRNHNAIGEKPQDPAIWDSQTQQDMKQVTLLRYQLLPHLYTLLYQSTMGDTVINPLFFNFPSDLNTLGIQDQFMWGKTLMVVPVITQGQTSRNAYFPAGSWFDFRSGCKMSQTSSGETKMVNVPISTIGLFAYGGSIVPWQVPSTTTYQSRFNTMGLTVALDKSHRAAGDLFWDDGITLGGQHLMFHMNVSQVTPRLSGILHIYRLVNQYRGADKLVWGSIYIYGLLGSPTSIQVNGQAFQGSQSYDSQCKTLRLTGMTLPFASGSRSVNTIEWFYN